MSWEWLPERQLHVVETFGHIDAQIADLHRRVLVYTAVALDFREVRLPDRFRLEVAAINPLPAIISRLAADILNGLRGALEHTLMAEVVSAVGRPLSAAEERAVEFPVTTDVAGWVRKHRGRKSNEALAADGDIVKRILALQPGDDESHPLRLLVEHTNYTKHRLPAVASTRQAAVTVVDRVTGGVRMEKRPRPIAVGDVVAESENLAEIDSFAYVALERPHTAETVILMAEIEAIEKWVREVAVPTLVTGGTQHPPLPPALPVHVGHRDVRTALAKVADVPPAVIREQNRASHAIARVGLTRLLVDRATGAEEAAVHRWVESLDFEATKTRLERLRAAGERGQDEEAAQQVIRIAVRAWTQSQDTTGT
jgi:hypothetical protein